MYNIQSHKFKKKLLTEKSSPYKNSFILDFEGL